MSYVWAVWESPEELTSWASEELARSYATRLREERIAMGVPGAAELVLVSRIQPRTELPPPPEPPALTLPFAELDPEGQKLAVLLCSSAERYDARRRNDG